MHPSHLLGVKQRVLQTDISAAKALIGRIRRVDEKEKLDALMIRLNA
jgi:hypothetical protein